MDPRYNSIFGIVAETGEVYVIGNNIRLDYETTASYKVDITVRDRCHAEATCYGSLHQFFVVYLTTLSAALTAQHQMTGQLLNSELELIQQEVAGKGGHGPLLTTVLGSVWTGVRKLLKTVRTACLAGQDLNPGPQGYDTGKLSIWPRISAFVVMLQVEGSADTRRKLIPA
jgi:hypothetical protein